ncbi:Uncharacterised protein [Arthrobacter agilis]|nr:Uncharacterised protein [Arthrobacter agilis]
MAASRLHTEPRKWCPVLLALSLPAAVTPSGDPTLRPDLDPASVTPGTLGFLATLFIVVIVIFLIRDMVKRVRRVRYAAEVEQARAAREEHIGGGSAAESDPGGGTDRVGGDAAHRDRPTPGGKHGPDNR